MNKMLTNGQDNHVSCCPASSPNDKTNIKHKVLNQQLLQGGHLLLTQRVIDQNVKANSRSEQKRGNNRLATVGRSKSTHVLRRSPSIGRRISSTLSGMFGELDAYEKLGQVHAQKPAAAAAAAAPAAGTTTTTATTTTTSAPARDHPEKYNSDLGCIKEDEDYGVVDEIFLPLHDLDLLDDDNDVEVEEREYEEQLNTTMDHNSNLPGVSSNQKGRVSSE